MQVTGRIEMLCFSSRRRHTIYQCDWSSDVCSSDLRMPHRRQVATGYRTRAPASGADGRDRKSVVSGKSVDLGGRRIIKKKNTYFLAPQQRLERRDSHTHIRAQTLSFY